MVCSVSVPDGVAIWLFTISVFRSRENRENYKISRLASQRIATYNF
jgi:hypothetical protein